MSPLEKAARALHDAGNWQVAENLSPHPPFEELSWVERGWLFTQARAVLLAVRDSAHPFWSDTEQEAWRDMIDAILEGGE